MGTFKKSPKKLGLFNAWKDLYIDTMIKTNTKFVMQSKVVVSDCDGILTDGRSVYDDVHKHSKIYGSYDKEAMDILLSLGWKFIFVSEDRTGLRITERRIEDLQTKFGLDNVRFENLNDIGRFNLVQQLKREGHFTMFIGDSLSDIKTLCEADFSATTKNSPSIVKDYCNYVSDLDGGYGGFGDILIEANRYLCVQQ